MYGVLGKVWDEWILIFSVMILCVVLNSFLFTCRLLRHLFIGTASGALHAYVLPLKVGASGTVPFVEIDCHYGPIRDVWQREGKRRIFFFCIICILIGFCYVFANFCLDGSVPFGYNGCNSWCRWDNKCF
jgi:hypothetical protein